MSSSPQESQIQSVIPLFMGKGRNTCFVLDCSLGMNGFLGPVKNLIVQTLITKASLRDSLFNIISFSSKETPWSSHMQPCTPDVVYESLNWIHTLQQTSPGRDLHTPLSLAFSDPACQSVHLVTSGVPDNPKQCLASLSTLETRPVHTFYLSDKSTLSTDISDFLQCFTSATGGNCYVMAINLSADVEGISLLHSMEELLRKSTYSEDTSCACSVPYWCSTVKPFSTVSCASARIMQGAELFPGSRVLARREIDGFYYLGTIMHQGKGNLYMVEFDKFGQKGNTFMETLNTVQQIGQSDMVNIANSHGHSIVPGDTVLAPWEPEMRRYGPGRVITGMELIDPLKGDEGNLELQVLFWNGMTVHVPKALAVWIPASHHEQIIKQLQQSSFRSCCSRVSQQNTLNCFELPNHWRNNHTQPSIPQNHCSVRRSWPVDMSNPLLNSQEIDELERKVDLQLKELKTKVSSSSSSSTSEEDNANEKHRSSGSELVSRSVNTEISCLRKPYVQPETRPAWRYWKRGSIEPQHKQPGRTVKTSNVSHSDDSTMTNHSCLFKLVPYSPKRGVNMRDIFGTTEPNTAQSPLIVTIKKRQNKLILVPQPNIKGL